MFYVLAFDGCTIAGSDIIKWLCGCDHVCVIAIGIAESNGSHPSAVFIIKDKDLK